MNRKDVNKNFNFRKFIGDAKIYDIMVGWTVGSQIKDFSDSIFISLIDPLLDYDWNGNNKKDERNIIREWSFKIGTMEFKIGKLILSFIKVSIMIFLIFYFTMLLRRILYPYSLSGN